MSDCLHTQFESLVTVTRMEPPGQPGYHQVRLQVRCAQCQGPLTFPGLPPVNPMLFLSVAVSAGGSELVLSGQVVPPTPAGQGVTWTTVVMPEPVLGGQEPSP